MRKAVYTLVYYTILSYNIGKVSADSKLNTEAVRLMEYHFIKSSKEMALELRDNSKTRLTEKEISYLKKLIKEIKGNGNVFVFNDEAHIKSSTCYDYIDDIVYVTRNVFPDLEYASTHPRDIMSPRAVLAHEYYGHRSHRNEYLFDHEKSIELGKKFHTTAPWMDECRASIDAALYTPNLTDKDRSDLMFDAVFRAREAGQLLETNNTMRRIMYGYGGDENEKKIIGEPFVFVSEGSHERTAEMWRDTRRLPKMQKTSENVGFRTR